MELLILPVLMYLALPALVLFLLYVVVRRAVRDGIWDAQRLEPDYPRPGVDAQRRRPPYPTAPGA